MRISLALSALAFASIPAANAEPVALFDGSSLDGWQSVGSAEWRVEDGAISGGQFGDPKKSGILMTEATFKDFDLSLEFKIDEHGKYNSGVYLRHGPGERRQRGYQINIGRGAAEEYVGLHFKEWLDKGDEDDSIRKPLDWNSLRIRAVGAHIEAWLNGKKIVDYTDPEPTPQLLEAGAIGFQTYGAEGHAGWVKFRNIHIVDLAHSDDELPHPNIIVFMADDMGMGDTSAYQDFTGNPDGVQYITPNMERLAAMGMRFTDAHTPSSRCSPTRYGLLTGRYPWRNRLKHWVLFGSQGDPMIEADRPTIASLLRDAGYRTGMVGKWHVGLRYTRSDGKPASGWADADLTKPLHTCPLDHGFDYARYTSRSHGTSGPSPGGRNRANGAKQNVGPGHLHGRHAVGATGDGKKLVEDSPDAYVLQQLGSRHSDHAMQFLEAHAAGGEAADTPFFLYYPSNSNHGPYTPSDRIGGVEVAGASGEGENPRRDYVFENDVALGRLLQWLESADDPRRPGEKLADNTIIIFTSDNGAERDSDIATGPFRSHKGSCYEGGHRVPFIASWPAGGIPSGSTNGAPVGLQDLFATIAEILGTPLPDLESGAKGAEDSHSILPALLGGQLDDRPPLFFNDHKQAKEDPAVCAMRVDDPDVGGDAFPGHWKIFFDARLLRRGQAHPFELYELTSDPKETNNRIAEPSLQPLVESLTATALRHRNAGGHRLAALELGPPIRFDWRSDEALSKTFEDAAAGEVTIESSGMKCILTAHAPEGSLFSPNERGLGISGGEFKQIDSGEAISIRFDSDVVLEHVAIVAGNGQCGGFYQVGDAAPLAIYCIDADIDAKDQSGVLSDLGVLKAGAALRLDSRPHFGSEAPGRWRLGALSVRPLVK